MARFLCSLCDDLSTQRSAFKLLKDAGGSVARKKELAKEAAESLVVAAGGSSSTIFGRCAARSVARWQRGPALAAAAAATTFRSALLFSLSDFIVSAAVETTKALLDAAREARGETGGPVSAPGRDTTDSSLLRSLCSGALALAKPLSEAGRAFLGVSSASPALAALLRSSAVALAFASAVPSLVRGGTAISSTSADFLIGGVAAGSLALAASSTALRAALGEPRAAELRSSVSRAAIRCAVGLSATSIACGCAAVLLPSWWWPAVQLAADNVSHAYLVAPAMKEQLETGRVGRERAVALSAALAAGCVAAVGVL